MNEPVAAIDLHREPIRSTALLSRYAESTVWLARYMERIENLARIIDVTETFTRTGQAEDGWRSIVQINADSERFYERYERAEHQSMVSFYVLDRDSPTSIATIINLARENARTLRPLISTEMWTHINMFHKWVRELTPNDIRPGQLSRLCARLKQECQTHNGITEGTFFRDQGWYFYVIGKHLERGDQITRLVDIKYHTLLPKVAAVGSPVDMSQWSAVLRSAAAYHAYRRVMPRALTPASVAGFLLLNNAFPRSLVLTLRHVYGALGQLRTDYGLRAGMAAQERIDELRAALADQTIEEIILRGLHEFLDWAQQQIHAVHDDVAAGFWPQPVVAAAAPAAEQPATLPPMTMEQRPGEQIMNGMRQSLPPLRSSTGEE
ncbi:alpha-E domain-containing protein [Rhizosaccharibacter radicis]|uniref:Alpha-E domain-containing protein n=1 Tax=Rhizosaccharibacter radicis TaxID=2782605 RepID=A0ABT1VWU5_9PROT|nr:alpha-E domain-containing protein [Acetobacteraceae bacterium KSS12]